MDQSARRPYSGPGAPDPGPDSPHILTAVTNLQVNLRSLRLTHFPWTIWASFESRYPPRDPGLRLRALRLSSRRGLLGTEARLTNDETRVLQSDVILFTSTKGKGPFFSPEQLYRELGVAARSPSMSPAEFQAFLEDMARRNLLRRGKVDPMSGKGEAYTGS